MCRLYPLFPGANELDQIAKIHDIMGTPSTSLLAKIRK
jgi:renal tumor antigen